MSKLEALGPWEKLKERGDGGREAEKNVLVNKINKKRKKSKTKKKYKIVL